MKKEEQKSREKEIRKACRAGLSEIDVVCRFLEGQSVRSICDYARTTAQFNGVPSPTTEQVENVLRACFERHIGIAKEHYGEETYDKCFAPGHDELEIALEFA